jgi:hypothetical protein
LAAIRARPAKGTTLNFKKDQRGWKGAQYPHPRCWPNPASARVGMNIFHDQPPEGMRREVITLDEGDVVITFPDSLTVESFGDLKAHLDLFIGKMKRRTAGVPRHVVTGETPPKTILGSVGEGEESEQPIKRRKIP